VRLVVVVARWRGLDVLVVILHGRRGAITIGTGLLGVLLLRVRLLLVGVLLRILLRVHGGCGCGIPVLIRSETLRWG
jgi:hypothetical protein